MRRTNGRPGFTLIEAIMSIVVVSVMMVAALETLGAAARTQRVQSYQQQRGILAEDLMTEILAQRFEDADNAPGSFGLPLAEVGSGTRILFDDVDDYHGWSESPPHTHDGTELSQYTGWTRLVQVRWARLDIPSQESGGQDTGLKRIRVTVRDPRGAETQALALRARSGPLDQPGDMESTFTSRVGVELQVGTTTSARLHGGTALLNQAAAAVPSGANVLQNPGFEGGAAPWFAYQGAAIGVSTTQPHGGAQRGEIADRDFAWSGVAQLVTGYIESGQAYELRAWVRMHSSPAVGRLVLYVHDGSAWSSVNVTGAAGVSWSEVSGQVTPVWAGDLTMAIFAVETTGGVGDFAVDDLVLREVE